MILHLRNPQYYIEKLLEIINSFGKVGGYKINIHKSVAFLYTNTEKKWETILLTIASKAIKYLGIHLMKETKVLFNEDYKPLKGEIEAIRRWKDLPCSWIGRINTVKMTILPKGIHV
jgi:hypothetical protein